MSSRTASAFAFSLRIATVLAVEFDLAGNIRLRLGSFEVNRVVGPYGGLWAEMFPASDPTYGETSRRFCLG